MVLHVPVIDDYVNRVGQRLLATLPPQPFDFHFHVIKEETYNAFAGPGGYIFIYSGLLADMDSESELAGILGHEIGHVVCRHIAKRIELGKKLGAVTIAGILAGILLGVAGAPTTGGAMVIGSGAAGQSAALAYSRADEQQADRMGFKEVTAAGYDPEGMVDVLKMIRSREWFGPSQVPTYLETHPAIEDRINWLSEWIQQDREAGHKAPVVRNEDDFNLIRTRVYALTKDVDAAKSYFQNALSAGGPQPMAHYGMGLVLCRMGYYREAVAQFRLALAAHPKDSRLLGDLGRALYMSGDVAHALGVLRQAVADGPDDPLAHFYYGRALAMNNDLAPALGQLQRSVDLYPDNPDAHYQLAEVLGTLGQMAAAHYQLAYRFYLDLKPRVARFHLEQALAAKPDPGLQEQIQQLKAALGGPGGAGSPQ